MALLGSLISLNREQQIPEVELLSNDTWISVSPIVIILFLVSIFFATGITFFYRSPRRVMSLMGDQALVSAPRWPLIGNLLEFFPEKSVESLLHWREKYGKFVEIYVLSQRMIMISDLKITTEILMSRPKVYRRIRSMEYFSKKIGIDRGLFMSNGSNWSRIRRFTAPSFSRRNIQQHVTDIWELAAAWTTRLEQRFAMTNTVCDFRVETFTYTLDAVTKVAFGLKLDYFTSSTFIQDTQAFFAFAMAHMSHPLPQWTWPYSPHFKYETDAMQANERMTAAAIQLIRQKKLELQQQGMEGCLSQSHSLIETMLRRDEVHHKGSHPSSHDEPTSNTETSWEDELELDIVGNIKTFYIAGAETTAVTIAFAIYYMSQYPELFRRLQQEADRFVTNNCDIRNMQRLFEGNIDGVAESDNGNSNADIHHLFSQLKLCEAIVKETLRLVSPANIMIYEREKNDDNMTHTLSNGLKIKPNDQVLLYVDGLLMDPEYFSDPLRFDPDRWLTSDVKRLEMMEQAFVVFGYGPRVCPGMFLAFIEAVFALTNIARTFDISLACPPSEVKRVVVFTATPNKVPIHLSMRRRPV